MTDKNNGPSEFAYLAHPVQTLFLEPLISDRQHFVHDHDLGLQMRSDSECKAHVHAARIMLHWSIYESLDFGEGNYLIKLVLDFCLLHPQDGAIQIDILAAGELAMKSRAYLQQRAHS